MKHDDASAIAAGAAATTAAVPSRVVSTIQQASQSTGISFSYLMAQAQKESNFATDTRSHRSSAAGLFQFTKGTWLQLIQHHGADHGLGDLAAKIHKTAKGDYVVHDAATRQEILDLRRDPKLSAMMAGEYAKDNKARLEHVLGRPVDSTDLYMAHFLGPAGAAKVLKARDEDPTTAAAALVPGAAHKNPTVFYDQGHSARSVAAVYDRIHQTIERPMRQFAALEDKDMMTVSAPLDGRPSAHGGPTAVESDPQWPFEAAHYPPSYVPTAPTAEPLPLATSSEEVAYADDAQSSDRISAPMPSAPGLPDDKGGFGKILSSVKKGLFG